MPNRTLRQVVEGQTVVSALADTTVRAAAITMAKHKIGAILVVDDQGRLAGLFTERDVLNRVVAQGLDPDSTQLSAVMTADLQTATPDKPLAHALHMMFEGGFRHVPVVEGGRPVGMVSARNALGLEIQQFEKELRNSLIHPSSSTTESPLAGLSRFTARARLLSTNRQPQAEIA